MVYTANWGMDYATYHLLGEPETTIDYISRNSGDGFRGFIHTDPHSRVMTPAWSSKQPVLNGCFNWMIPNHYMKNWCFTKHPFKTRLFGFQVFFVSHVPINSTFLKSPRRVFQFSSFSTTTLKAADHLGRMSCQKTEGECADYKGFKFFMGNLRIPNPPPRNSRLFPGGYVALGAVGPLDSGTSWMWRQFLLEKKVKQNSHRAS